jgi:hypothetical protein
MAAVCVQAIWTSSAPSTSSLGAAASIARAQHSWRVRKFRPKENDTQIAVEITKRSRSRSTLCRGLCSAVSTNLHPRRRGNIAGTTAKRKTTPQPILRYARGRIMASRLCLRRLKAGSPQPHRRAMKSPGAGNAGLGKSFAERVVTGRTDGRCSAERTITTGAVRAVLICRL